MERRNEIDEVVARLERVTGPDADGWWTALCPFHDDHSPSLRLTARGFQCMACAEKGGLRKLATKLGLVPVPIARRTSKDRDQGVTLAQLAQAKGLPIETLRELGWHDVEYQRQPAVAIPFRDASGSLLREQLRIRLEKGTKRDGRFLWAPGQGAWPLGLDRLQQARDMCYILIVEGATDYAACVSGGVPALGLPGANTWRMEWSAYLGDIDRLLVWQEADAGGTAMVSAIACTRSDLLVVLAPPDAKDPCALRQLDPDNFRQRMEALLTAAEPLVLSESAPIRSTSTVAFDPLTPAAEKVEGSAADRAIKYIVDNGAELFHNQHGDSFMAFTNEAGRREVWAQRSKAVSEFIRWCFYRQEMKGLTGEALATAKGTLAAMARFEGKRRELSVRVAKTEGVIWYDLGDWRGVRVTHEGWQVVENPPIIFRHYGHQVQQVEPVRGGTLEPFLDLLNLSGKPQRLLLLVYVVAALLPGIPLPVMLIHGEQGSAKSMLLTLLRALLDPSSLATFAPPDSLREFVQLAAHHRTVYLDNMTHLPDWLSDAICRLCTGEGFSKRELYTDDDDIVYTFYGLGGITGINLVATRSDLLDRAFVLKLEAIAQKHRLSEKMLWERFGQMRPYVLGAMFDALAESMRRFPTVDLAGETPRLADFAQWGMAIAEALGHSRDEFLQAYGINVEAQHQAALEESLVAQAILGWLPVGRSWEGTAADLLRELEAKAEELRVNIRARAWPKASNSLANKLREIAPNLRGAGLTVEDRRIHGIRHWNLTRDARRETAPTAPITTSIGGQATTGDSAGSPCDALISPPPQSASPPTALGNSYEEGDGGDGGDDFPNLTAQESCDPWDPFLEEPH